MSRDLPSRLATAIEKPVVRPFLALRLEVTDDPVYAWTGLGTLEFADADGNVRQWAGVSEFASIEAIGEASDGSATGMRATLYKVPEDFRDYVFDNLERGALFEVYFGNLNETYRKVEAVQLLWKGVLDSYRIIDAGATLAVEVTGESRAIDQRRPAVNRYSHEAQQRRSPGDLFFEYRAQMAGVQIIWNQAEPKGGGGGTGNGGFSHAGARSGRQQY